MLSTTCFYMGVRTPVCTVCQRADTSNSKLLPKPNVYIHNKSPMPIQLANWIEINLKFVCNLPFLLFTTSSECNNNARELRNGERRLQRSDWSVGCRVRRELSVQRRWIQSRHKWLQESCSRGLYKFILTTHLI